MDPKQTVLAFIDAMNREDFTAARRHTNNDMIFRGVLGQRDGADSYFGDMEKMKLKYAVKKAFADDRDVCLIYDVHMNGLDVLTVGWYTLHNEKISSIRVVFDPRPLFDDKKD